MIPQRTRIDTGLKERERVLVKDGIFKVIRVRPNGKVTLRFEGNIADTLTSEKELQDLKDELAVMATKEEVTDESANDTRS